MLQGVDMKTTNCESLHCRFSEWWLLQPRFVQNMTMSLVMIVIFLIFAVVAQIIGDGGSEWIWHIPG